MKRKNEKGITLIALVVTIIVLLILASITINLLVGENGLIKRAKDSALQHVIGEKKEVVALALEEEFIAERGVASDITVEGLLNEIRTSQRSTAIYALKDVNGTENPITTTEGSTPLGCKIVFPKSVTGAAKTDIIITVDEYGKVTNVSTDDGGENPPSPPATSYTITYDKNDANATGTMAPTVGATPQVAANGFTAPSGKQFAGWNTLANGNGNTVTVGTTLNANTTLYAQWENEQVAVYEQGDKVKIGDEYFYVLTENDTSTATTIELFAMYNLNSTAEATGTYAGHYMQLANAPYEDTACMYSTDQYWYYNDEIVTGDLNNYAVPRTGLYAQSLETSAFLKADDYAKAIAGSTAIGKLLDYERATQIMNGNDMALKYMLWGQENKQGEYSTTRYLTYWLSTVNYGNLVYTVSNYKVSPYQVGIEANMCTSSGVCGVRPVITVPKTFVEPIND